MKQDEGELLGAMTALLYARNAAILGIEAARVSSTKDDTARKRK